MQNNERKLLNIKKKIKNKMKKILKNSFYIYKAALNEDRSTRD